MGLGVGQPMSFWQTRRRMRNERCRCRDCSRQSCYVKVDDPIPLLAPAQILARVSHPSRPLPLRRRRAVTFPFLHPPPPLPPPPLPPPRTVPATMDVPLELQLKQATRLKNLLEALTDLFSEVTFNFSGTGCEIQAVDTSFVALFSLLICPDDDADAIAHYRCSRDISMCLNLAEVAAVFRDAENNDKVTIKAKGSKALSITFESEDGEILDRCLNAHHTDDKPLQPEEPSKHEATINLPSAQFMHICNKLSIFGEDQDTVVTITVDKEGVCFFTRGEDGTSEISCPPNETTKIDMKENVQVTFSLRYIKSFLKASTLSDQVTIILASNYPSVFKYKIAGMGYVRYYIAPFLANECVE